MAEINIKQQTPTPVGNERKSFDFPTEIIELPSIPETTVELPSSPPQVEIPYLEPSAPPRVRFDLEAIKEEDM